MNDQIIDYAAHLFGITSAELLGSSRLRHVCVARHAVAYTLRHRSPYLSLMQIAILLGRTDHSTIASSLRAAQALRSDPYFATRLSALLSYEVSYV